MKHEASKKHPHVLYSTHTVRTCDPPMGTKIHSYFPSLVISSPDEDTFLYWSELNLHFTRNIPIRKSRLQSSSAAKKAAQEVKKSPVSCVMCAGASPRSKSENWASLRWRQLEEKLHVRPKCRKIESSSRHGRRWDLEKSVCIPPLSQGAVLISKS